MCWFQGYLPPSVSNMVRLVGVAPAVLLGVAIVWVAAAEPTEQLQDSQVWWKTASLYQIYPRSFKDSDGDGVGDLKGITQMAGYFQEIGVDAIWLSPIYTSPMADFGYDIANFTDVDPIFGTMKDFDDLVAAFKSLNIKILLDFVPNHSSDEHPWFKKSVANDTDYADFYVWADAKYDNQSNRIPPNNWISVFAGPAWKWNDQRNQYYLHQFVEKQPDLNYRNPAVVGNMSAVISFWLDKGVDGLRMDAVQHMFEAKNLSSEPIIRGNGSMYSDLDHIYIKNQPETYAILKDWADLMYKRVQQDGRQRCIILEVYDKTPIAVSYYYSGDQGLEFPFNFNLLSGGNQSVRAPYIKYLIDDWINNAPKGGQLNWAVGNHDNYRVADRYGFEMVDSINLLTGVLPGIKVTYNGEEIGMRDTFIRWDQTVDPSGRNLGPQHYMDERGTRDPERTPMQWDDTLSSGFSTGDKTWLPLNPNYWWLNVQAQRDAETSHLKVYQTLMNARKDPVFMYGDTSVLAPDNDTLAVVRSYQGSYFALVINTGSQQRSYTSQNFFKPNNLDVSMYVVVSSINCNYRAGLYQQQGSLSFSLRPKAAVLLTTKTWNPSNTTTTTPSTPTTAKPSGAVPLLVSPLLIALAAVPVLRT